MTETDDVIDPNLTDFIRAYIECPAFDHDLSGSPRDRIDPMNARDAADVVFSLTGPAHTREIFFYINDKGSAKARKTREKLAPLAIWIDTENDCGELKDTRETREALNKMINRRYTFADWVTGKLAYRFDLPENAR